MGTELVFEFEMTLARDTSTDPMEITVKKVADDSGKPLADAIFTLTKQDNNAYSPGVQTTDSEGNLTFSLDIPRAGTYILHEVTPPEGYQALESDITLYIDENGDITSAVPETFTNVDSSNKSLLIVKNINIPSPSTTQPEETTIQGETTITGEAIIQEETIFTTETENHNKNPETGIGSQLIMWSVLCILTGMVFVVTLVYKRKTDK